MNFFLSSPGKLGQKPSQPCVEFVDHPTLGGLFSNQSLDIKSVFPINEDVYQVNYEKKEDFIQDSLTQAPLLNALICTKARIKLYKAIQAVRRRHIKVCYVDTDSLILVVPKSVTDIGKSIHPPFIS